MRRTRVLYLSLLLICSCLCAQAAVRIVILPANGPLAQANPAFALGESRVADSLTGKLTSQPGFTVVDRANVEKLLKEQNFQNSDRSSSDTAVRIGKIAGVGQIVLVQVYDGSYSTHQEKSGNVTFRNVGTVLVKTNARLIDVESGVILAQPSSSFEGSAPLTETKTWPVLATKQLGDPKVIVDDLWSKATDAVTAELAAKLTEALSHRPAEQGAFPLVAGLANGNTYINKGATSGVKKGDQFQITRVVKVEGITDPATGAAITEKHTICKLVIANVNDGSASGTCQGELPQKGDQAEPPQ